MKKYTKGFTLIELLVVIAIIGILSSVVLVSLNSARNKGNDAKVQSELGQIRTSAEVLYSNTGSAYGTAVPATNACPATAGSLSADPNVVQALAAMPAGTTVRCGVNATFTAYAVAASLTGGAAGDYWCIDSTGAAGKINITTPANVIVGDATCAAMDAR